MASKRSSTALGAAAIGLVFPVIALILFVIMVVFHAVTSGGIHAIPFLARRRSRRSNDS
ncbi:hypothetical protein [Cupriavidus sp. D39]|uniref:hypothetical protein n=1 Tax=Cupriavidus sp. D39 TaxID=2997877 RepID=UPI002271D6A7|nr:hypothetical protein [Cupriavidus sp. D39]MCY0853875.1 hypothetical protein [Cupriavidus sp. D39]